MTRHGSARARFGPFEVDLHTHELWKFGTRLKLVGQPFEILAVLLSQPGELVTREELRTRLWPADTFVDFNHGLNAAVNKLREALSDSADAPRYVETLPRRGYRFMATVEWVEAKRVMAEIAMAKTPDALLGETVKPPSPAEVTLEAAKAPVQVQATGDRAWPRDPGRPRLWCVSGGIESRQRARPVMAAHFLPRGQRHAGMWDCDRGPVTKRQGCGDLAQASTRESFIFDRGICRGARGNGEPAVYAVGC